MNKYSKLLIKLIFVMSIFLGLLAFAPNTMFSNIACNLVNVQAETLTLSGKLTKSEVQSLIEDGNGDITEIIADETAVLPEDCNYLFRSYQSYISAVVKIDISKADASNVKNMANMFENYDKVNDTELDNLNTSQVTDMNHMFSGCKSLSIWREINLDTSQVTDMSYMFAGCKSFVFLNLSKFKTNNVTNMSHMFDMNNTTTTSKLNILIVSDSFDTRNVTDMSYMFLGCNKLSLDSYGSANWNLDTSNVTNMRAMFAGYGGTKIPQITNFSTNNTTDMSNMFEYCKYLKTLDLTNFNTANVTGMSRMFLGCSALTTLDISNFNTANATKMTDMFSGCSALKNLDITNFNTNKVHYVNNMFENCNSLISLDLSNFSMSQVGYYYNGMNIFKGCNKLKKIKLGNQKSTYQPVAHNNYAGGYSTGLINTPGWVIKGTNTIVSGADTYAVIPIGSKPITYVWYNANKLTSTEKIEKLDENLLYTYDPETGKLFIIYLYSGTPSENEYIKIESKAESGDMLEITDESTRITTVYKSIQFPDGSVYNAPDGTYAVAVRLNNDADGSEPDKELFNFVSVKGE